MEHLTPKAHHSLRAANNGWEAKQNKRFILGVQHHMDRIDETSKKLLDLFLCKEERQQQFIRTAMKEINEENQMRQWGVTQAKPLQREQPQAPPASPQAAAVSQDPAILVIQPTTPPPQVQCLLQCQVWNPYPLQQSMILIVKLQATNNPRRKG